MNIAFSIAEMVARGEAARMKISEATRDYAAEIKRLQEGQRAREQVMESEIGRARELGVTALTERGAQAEYETKMAAMKAEQAVSAGESRIGAGGIRASGTVLAAAQQQADIAYAGAQRTAEAGAAQMKIGGLQLKGQLLGGEEQKSLLTLQYSQALAEQKRKKAELESNASAMIAMAYAGGLAGVGSSFYQSTQTKLWG